MAITYTKQLYANNASTTLASAIGTTDTVISITDGSRFPTPGPDEFFLITISNGASFEVIEVRGRVGNMLTSCVRGRDGTAAQPFAAASRVENRLTAGALSEFTRKSDRLAPVSKLSDLGKAELLNNNSYLISEVDDSGNPIVAIANMGSWRFVNYPSLVLTQTADASATATSITYAGSTDLSKAFRERGLLIQFTTGLNRGQSRVVRAATATTATWQEPLPYSLTAGDRFEVYQSSTSLYNLLADQVSWLLGEAGFNGVDFATFVTTTALGSELAKLEVKQSARAATTGNINLTGTQTIDGIALAGGDRVLVKNQTTASQNGIYVVDAGTWQRASDADGTGELRTNMLISVSEGNTQAGTFWRLSTLGTITIGTTALTFVNIFANYAQLASPALSGTPTSPTAPTGTSTTQVATTAFVNAEIANDAAPISHVGATGTAHGTATTSVAGFMSAADKTKLDGVATSAASVGSISPLMDGAAAAGVSTTAARSDHVHPTDTTRAPLASPALAGVPTAPTAATTDNSTQLATTAFVANRIANDRPYEATVANIKMNGAAAVGTATTVARGDHVHPTDTTRAPLASPALTGTPTAPTAAAGTNTTQLATTAFVTTAVSTASGTAVQKDSNTGAAQLPSGTTAQRSTNGKGKIRFNEDTSRFEGNNGSAWGSLGGATGGGTDSIFYLNGQTISTDYTIPSGQNAMCAGPVTISNGVTVTVSDGSVWVVV